MIGTFALVFAGCGAIMINALSGGSVTHVGVGLTFGLVIMVMIYATGHISGAHFNPAVTLAFASVGRFPWKQVPFYIAGQIVAALLASFMLASVLGPIESLGATMPAGAPMQSLVLEGVLTFFLMFVITAVATGQRWARLLSWTRVLGRAGDLGGGPGTHRRGSRVALVARRRLAHSATERRDIS